MNQILQDPRFQAYAFIALMVLVGVIAVKATAPKDTSKK